MGNMNPQQPKVVKTIRLGRKGVRRLGCCLGGGKPPGIA